MSEQYKIEEIFKQYHNKVYHLALNIVRNEKDAEDILQNTIIKIINNIGSFKGRSQLSTWIYRIAYNEALMYIRKKYKQLNLSDYINRIRKETTVGLFINWPKLPSEDLLDSEFKKRLDSAIKIIPIKYRMPLLLHNVEGMPLTETTK